MNGTPAHIEAFVNEFLADRLQSRGDALQEPLAPDCDLLLSGIIDSMGLLELITAIQERFQKEIDFDALDPELMTVVGPLCQFVSDQINRIP